MELKILGKIPLENLERGKRIKSPESFLNEMDNRLKNLSEKTNERFGEILDKEGRVRIDDEDDLRYIKIKEEAWASEAGISLGEYNERQDRSKGSLAEVAVTLALDKILGDRFLSVRSSKWDDYENGVDNLLLDTKTGTVICGLDEIYNDLGGGREIKEEKIMNKFKKGGARTKYGLKLEEDGNSISIASLYNLPTFYIAIDKKNLVEIMENLSKEEISPAEIGIINELISSLELQLKNMNEYSETERINNRLKDNLSKMPALIEYLKERVSNI